VTASPRRVRGGQVQGADSASNTRGFAARRALLAMTFEALIFPAALKAVQGGEPEPASQPGQERKLGRPVLAFGELARLAQGMPGVSLPAGQTPGLEHTAWFAPPQASYCNGTHVAEVEVDPMTGGVTILNYVAAHDCGNVINPMIVDGQVQGGVAHGIGNALFEFVRYDAAAQPITTSFADYLLPSAADVAGCVIEHVETPNPLNPLGVKGAGEGGTIPAPAAIIAAIEDALSPFGVRFAEMPLTPDRIVAALAAAGAYVSRRPAAATGKA
jgi:aerobic carbon-monoxide dehydrogenase large subunit